MNCVITYCEMRIINFIKLKQQVIVTDAIDLNLNITLSNSVFYTTLVFGDYVCGLTNRDHKNVLSVTLVNLKPSEKILFFPLSHHSKFMDL